MKKTQLISLAIITLLLSVVPAAADDSFEFHESVVKDAVFEWKFKTLEESYDDSNDDPDFPFDQGDTLQVVIEEDPTSENVTNWQTIFDYEINEVDISNSDLGGLFGIMYWTGAFALFISPLEVGTQNYINAIYDSFLSYASSWNDAGNGTAVASKDDKIISLDLEDTDGTNTITVYTEYSVETGFLNEYSISQYYEDSGGDASSLDLTVSKGGNLLDRIGIPFDWQFSVMGLAFLGLIAFVIRRKKN